jgi:prolyl 4-hydroxylase
MQLNKIANTIFTIEDFWTPKECQAYIDRSELIGYEPATVQTESGPRLVTTVRNNNRVIYKDFSLADQLWQQLKDLVPTHHGNSISIGLNELFRFYKYEVGQQFRKHRDESYIPNATDASYYTFMIYLNDDYQEGETTFDEIAITPKQGMALIFEHSLEHSGNPVKEEIKYVLRTDIMYRLEKI